LSLKVVIVESNQPVAIMTTSIKAARKYSRINAVIVVFFTLHSSHFLSESADEPYDARYRM